MLSKAYKEKSDILDKDCDFNIHKFKSDKEKLNLYLNNVKDENVLEER
jgi:hypothetical protein